MTNQTIYKNLPNHVIKLLNLIDNIEKSEFDNAVKHLIETQNERFLNSLVTFKKWIVDKTSNATAEDVENSFYLHLFRNGIVSVRNPIRIAEIANRLGEETFNQLLNILQFLEANNVNQRARLYHLLRAYPITAFQVIIAATMNKAFK